MSNKAAKRKSTDEVVQMDTVKKACVSDIRFDVIAFAWSLKNYRKMASLSQSRGSIRSPVFSGGSKYKHDWIVDVTPRKEKDGVQFLKICLKLKKSGNEQHADKPVKAGFKISIIDMNGRVLKTKTSQCHDFVPGGTSWGFRFIPSILIEDPTKGYLVDGGDTLNIHCEVEVSGKISHTALDPPLSSQTRHRDSLLLLKQNMKSLINDDCFSDVTLLTETKSFYAHKNILAARSPVFKAMLDKNFAEAALNEINIPDFPDDVIEAMLEYIYTGDSKSLEKNALDLLRISDKYELLGLKSDCEQVIASNVSVVDAAEVYVLAHLHSPHLKPKIVSFINRFRKEVQESESFKRVKESNPTILVDLLTTLQ